MNQPLDYQFPPPKRTARITWRICLVALVSALFGIICEAIVFLTQGSGLEAFKPCFLVAAGLSGITAGLFALWSKHAAARGESLAWCIANYYVGLFSFGAYLLVLAVISAIARGSLFWLSAAVSEQTSFLVAVLIYGTFPFSLLMVPLTFLARHVVWRIYKGNVRYSGASSVG